MHRRFGKDDKKYDDCPWSGAASLRSQCQLMNALMMMHKSHDAEPNFCWYRGDNETMPDELLGFDPAKHPQKQKWIETVLDARRDCVLRHLAGDSWENAQAAAEFLKREAKKRREAEEDHHKMRLSKFLGFNFSLLRRRPSPAPHQIVQAGDTDE